MKYSILSTLEYYKGRIALLCSRFNNLLTGNTTLLPTFIRRCLEWSSSKSENDIISVLVLSNGIEDGSLGIFDEVDKINVYRGELEDVTDFSFLSSFDCLIIFGVDNNISPVIRSNIEQYIKEGGGFILSDIKIDNAYISILENIDLVYVQSSGINFPSGSYLWTDDGMQHYIYQQSFWKILIPGLNTISEIGLSPSWSMLYVYDTSIKVVENPEIIVEEGVIRHSSDYDIPGVNFVAYFSSIYKNGMFKVET